MKLNSFHRRFDMFFNVINIEEAIKTGSMTTKEKVISGINKLPDNVSIDDILDQIILVEKIEKGIDQSNKGQIVPDEELDQRLGKWLG